MSFERIKGQNRAINMLKAEFISDRISHAYLFLGLDGVGKLKTAYSFAQLINCENPQMGCPCGKCSSCKKIISGVHPDIKVINPEGSSIRINQIRQMQNNAYLKCYEGIYKVILIDDAHLMTLQAANSLLKILEEPPESTIIILISNDVKRIPSTVLSRCQIIKFNPLSDSDMKEIISDMGMEIKVPLNIAQGSISKALELISNNEYGEIYNNVNQMVLNIHQMGYKELFRLAEEFSKDKDIVLLVIGILSGIYRDKLVSIAKKDNNDLINSYIDVQKVIDKAYFNINCNANNRLVMEVLFLDLYHIEKKKGA